MTLSEEFARINSVFIDTAPIIYYLQGHAEFGPLAREVVITIESGSLAAYSSVLTLTEVLIKPMAINDVALAHKFVQFIKYAKHLTLIEISEAIAETAGNLRGRYSFLKTVDALQVAAALDVEADAFLTKDAKLTPIKELRVILLKDYLLS
ncbi:MAG: type II toxin-antitoxin system VapC family toxin [Desulfomonilaceae bacterium]